MDLKQAIAAVLASCLIGAMPCAAEDETQFPDYEADFRAAAQIEGDLWSDWLLMAKLGEPVGRFTTLPPREIPEGEDSDLLAALLLQNADEFRLDSTARQELEQRLLPAASENSYIALVLMGSAVDRGDRDAQVRALAIGAQAEHYRSPFLPAFRSLVARMREVESEHNEGLPVVLFGYDAAFEAAVYTAIPRFHPLVTLCKDVAPGLRDACWEFAVTMRYESHTLIEPMMAAAVMDFIASPDPKNPGTDARAPLQRLLAAATPMMDNLEELPEPTLEIFLETFLAKGELAAVRRLLCLHPGADPVAEVDPDQKTPVNLPAPCAAEPNVPAEPERPVP